MDIPLIKKKKSSSPHVTVSLTRKPNQDWLSKAYYNMEKSFFIASCPSQNQSGHWTSVEVVGGNNSSNCGFQVIALMNLISIPGNHSF